MTNEKLLNTIFKKSVIVFKYLYEIMNTMRSERALNLMYEV